MLFAEYCLNEQYSIASTKRDANYIFSALGSSEDVFPIASRAIRFLEPYSREETPIVRGILQFETFAKDGNARGVCDKKFVFQLEQSFPADFLRIQKEDWKLQNRMCEE